MPSYTSELLANGKEKEDTIKWSAAAMYTAGADTVCANLIYKSV